jgi:hypothetical protein
MLDNGVVLSGLEVAKSQGKYIHASGGDWFITSDIPLTFEFLSCDLLEMVLPGLLGCFFYPADATFHTTNTEHTSMSHYLHLVGVGHELTLSKQHKATFAQMNHLTVKQEIIGNVAMSMTTLGVTSDICNEEEIIENTCSKEEEYEEEEEGEDDGRLEVGRGDEDDVAEYNEQGDRQEEDCGGGEEGGMKEFCMELA